MRSPTGRIIVRIFAVLLCVVGLVLSFYLLQKHWQPPQAAVHVDENSLAGLLDKGCTTIIPEADCDEAIKSQWGMIPGLNVPTAALGLYYFTGLFWWFLLIGPVSYSRRGIHLLVTAVVATGLGFSIFLVYQMSRSSWCTWCLFTHAANFLIFVCLLVLWPRRPRIVGVSAPGLRNPRSEGLFRESAGVAHLEHDWPTGFALLVLPIIMLLSFALEFVLGSGAVTPRVVVDEMKKALVQAQKDIEIYQRMAAGDDVTAELQEEIRVLRDTVREMSQELQTEIAKHQKDMELAQEQMETLRKAASGSAVTAELEKLQKDLRTAQELRDYYQKQFQRYDSKWQHTYMAWAISPPARISMENARVRGPANARHTLTIYSDYQCPTCKYFEDMLKQRIMPLADRHGGLRVVFKMWPISTSCNPTAKTDLHPVACDASLAAQAAFMLGGNEAFWKMHDLLFETQSQWKRTTKQLESGVPRPDFTSYAVQIGLNPDAFRKAMTSPEALAAVKADIEEGINLGKDLMEQGLITAAEQEVLAVNSTPSIFIDNKRLATVHHFRTWQQILQGVTPEWKPERRATTRPATNPNDEPAVQPQGELR